MLGSCLHFLKQVALSLSFGVCAESRFFWLVFFMVGHVVTQKSCVDQSIFYDEEDVDLSSSVEGPSFVEESLQLQWLQ